MDSNDMDWEEELLRSDDEAAAEADRASSPSIEIISDDDDYVLLMSMDESHLETPSGRGVASVDASAGPSRRCSQRPEPMSMPEGGPAWADTPEKRWKEFWADRPERNDPENPYYPLWEYRENIAKYFKKHPEIKIACAETQRRLVRSIARRPCKWPGTCCTGKEEPPTPKPLGPRGRIMEPPTTEDAQTQTTEPPKSTADKAVQARFLSCYRQKATQTMPSICEEVGTMTITPPMLLEQGTQTEEKHMSQPHTPERRRGEHSGADRYSPYPMQRTDIRHLRVDGTAKSVRPSLRGCYNCGEMDHRYSQCTKPPQCFCYRCGLRGVTVRHCPTCSADWHQEGPYIHALGSHVPRNVKIEEFLKTRPNGGYRREE